LPRRYYRNSLVALRRAVDSWRRADVDFAIHFGDIVDGFQPRDGSVQAINDVLGALDRLQKPHYHMLGNHCLYNLPRPVLNKMLDIPDADGGGSYYAFSPHPGVRIIVLDGYDISILGWPEGHPHRELAKALLDKHNPSEDKNNPELMEGNGKRFVMFGGGVSEAQLAWLKAELQQAKAGDQTVSGRCVCLVLCSAAVASAAVLQTGMAAAAAVGRG
jgi:manganese-dependent ADP-ribose/CDP-alcohol diphosphatase